MGSPRGAERIAEYPRPSHTLLHITDTHLVGGDELLYGTVDADARVQQILADIRASGVQPDALVFTGDLADRGQPDAYAKLRGLVEPVAQALGAQIVWAMGNHDDRATFRELLLDQAPSTGPIDRVYHVDGLRIITLDTSVPGFHHGEVSQEQLNWLAQELETSAPFGTILAMHHPPVPSVFDQAVLVELRDQAGLAEVLRDTDVRTILAGHLHYTTTATFADIPVSVASSTCYTQDLNVPAGCQRGHDGAQGFNLVHVYPDTIVHSVVPTGSYATAGRPSTAEDAAQRLAEAGIRIPENPDVTVRV
ncbi:3',5'-cyclic adenosine monophosphate phosphodiesterase CpdA [Rhodococcus ruber]|uniref:phosphodiesterase n=1 Tax=Rhodococcus ruber TaxID=1830 RepID=UPI0026F42985|nr:phosphodiesterase [Rhodococcus ruber]MDO2381554.1 phosphodiesterase [Rhodococcus ruber]